MSPKRILIPRHYQVTAAQVEALKAEEKLEDISKSEIVRRALYAYFRVENEEELEKKTQEMKKEIWRRFKKKEPQKSPAPDEE